LLVVHNDNDGFLGADDVLTLLTGGHDGPDLELVVTLGELVVLEGAGVLDATDPDAGAGDAVLLLVPVDDVLDGLGLVYLHHLRRAILLSKGPLALLLVDLLPTLVVLAGGLLIELAVTNVLKRLLVTVTGLGQILIKKFVPLTHFCWFKLV